MAMCGMLRGGPAIALLLAAGSAGALDLQAHVDRTEVGTDGRIALTLTVRGGHGEPEIDLGSTEGFQVYSAGTSQSISIVNGQVSSSITYTYLLSPRAEGEFSVGPFEASQGGEEGSAPAIRIRVTRSAAQEPPDGREQAARPRTGRGETRDVFLTTSLDKTQAYVGEALTLTFRLYTRIRFGADPKYEPPSTEGFWKEDLPPQQRFFDDYDDVRYSVTEVRTALFPTRAGRLVVGPARLSYVEDTFFSVDPFDLLRGGGASRRRGVQQTVETDSIVVQVTPLPEQGRPAGFGGAVGSFMLEASIDKPETAANEPVTLTVTLKGEGNIQAATLPESRVPDSFKVYDSGSSTETSKEGYRVRGKKTYTRVLVPRYGGEYEIAPVSFTYFDPSRREYVTRSAGPFRVRVEGPPPEEATDRMEIAKRDEDIRYLKEPAAVAWERQGTRPPILALVAGNTFPLLLLGALFLVHKRRERYATDPGWARARRAERRARALLDAAGKRTDERDSRAFAAHLSRAIGGFLADKGKMPAAGMTRRELERELEGRGAGPELRARISRFLEACDRARYAAEPLPPSDRTRLLREGRDLLPLLGRLFAEKRG